MAVLQALHPICVELARLHSKAVDFPKTGVPALMSKDLRPMGQPHFRKVVLSVCGLWIFYTEVIFPCLHSRM